MKLKIYLLYAVVLISIIGYVPYIYMSNIYSLCRMMLFGAMALLLILTVVGNSGPQPKNKTIATLFILLTIIAILFLAFYGIGLNITPQDLLQTAIPIFGTYITFNISLSKEQVERMIVSYIIAAIIVSFLSINTYLGIQDETNAYLIEGKNQIGVIIALATGLSFYYWRIQTGIRRIFGVICFITSFIIAFMIECRTAFLGSILCIVLTLYKTTTTKQLLLFGLCVFIAGLVFYEKIYAVFLDFFVGDRIVIDANDLSTGRMERNIAGVDFLANHIFIGELKELSYIPLIHNYLLLKLVRYGLFALPFITIYFLYLVRSVRGIMKTAIITDISLIGFLILSIPFFCSLLEPGAPFGPGSIYVFAYMLFGYSLRSKQFD